MTGNGTNYNWQRDEIVSNLAGMIAPIDHLQTVQPLFHMYKPQNGDVVIGRVVKIDPQRWYLDIASHCWAILDLSSIVVDREGNYAVNISEDCLHMREYFSENDLIACQVQKVSDCAGTIQLGARARFTGKLVDGFLVTVRHVHIRPMKS